MLIAQGITAGEIFALFCVPFAVGLIVATITTAIATRKLKKDIDKLNKK